MSRLSPVPVYRPKSKKRAGISHVAYARRARKQSIGDPRGISRVTALGKGVRRLEEVSDRMQTAINKRIQSKLRRNISIKEEFQLLEAVRNKSRRLLSSRRVQLEGMVFRDQSFPDVLNKNSFREETQARLHRPGPHTLVMIDLDFFKKYNDSFGHHAGDDVLRLFSQVLHAHSNKFGGFAGRYGGEEFMIYAPVTQKMGRDLVQRIRTDLRGRFAKELLPQLNQSLQARSLQQRARGPEQDLLWALDRQLPFSAGLVSTLTITKPLEITDRATGTPHIVQVSVPAHTLAQLEKEADDLSYVAKKTRDALVEKIGGKVRRTAF
ncbi:MAG: GGDEF domain-containing protein [Candidatus Diapherotrites archaeon]|nr:GGDEF domain-containing protein [Candidatus Diapherotrites archaeon]